MNSKLLGSRKSTIFIKINKLAIKNNCLCLDEKYVNMHTLMNWACSNGHVWQRSWEITNKGHWCSDCVKEKLIIPKITNIFNKQNVLCVLNKLDVCDEYNFICKNNHFWSKNRKHITNKTRCKQCFLENKINLAHKIAKDRNGFCLSHKYVKDDSKLLWKCYLGHEWNAKLSSVKTNTWCPTCNINVGEEITRNIFEILFNEKFKKIRPTWLNRLELDGYSDSLKIAFEYDGMQHYKFIKFFHKTKNEFKNRRKIDLLKNELCSKNNIILFRIPYYIKFEKIKKYIVSLCKKNDIFIPNNIDIDYKKFNFLYGPNIIKFQKINDLVRNNKGSLMSDKYINNRSKLIVKCDNGHEWKTNAEKLKCGYWCPYCSQKKKHTIEEMVEIATSKSGKCLSKKYINNSTKLLWECKLGHQWYAVPKTIVKGHWCPKCQFIKIN